MQGRSVPECQAFTTSSEFFGWIAYFEWRETEERTKLDFYLAQIAAEIRLVRQMFAKEPQAISIEDCMLSLKKDNRGRAERTEKTKQRVEPVLSSPPPSPSNIPPWLLKYKDKLKFVESGPELVNDPKWAEANARAKAQWIKPKKEPE